MEKHELDQCYLGDCRDTMRDLIAAGVRVQCVITSPPYWALRDYGVDGQLGLEAVHDCAGWATGSPCGECHICHMVEVFDLVYELLADDGTLWLNYGDCYASSGGPVTPPNGKQFAGRRRGAEAICQSPRGAGLRGLKPKDLAGMPWRLALALQAAGWHLRQDIIWHKPSPMPESVRDRCTKAHEYLFLLSKSGRYYYDFEAMKEPVTGGAHARGNGVNAKIAAPAGWDGGEGSHTKLTGRYVGNGVGFGRGTDAVQRQRGRVTQSAAKDVGRDEQDLKTSAKFGREPGWRTKQNESFSAAVAGLVDTRNRRSVWTIPSEPFSGAHFATFPQALVEPCILAGSRPGDVVFDPFLGSGTVAQVAQRLGRRWLGCELNPDYLPLQDERTRQPGLAFTA
ncbi:DNA-methyltransferase [Crenobacter cavernae]|uniref:Methyltransferase n=1 Tax=Crenobacter cavernae TaxID=2290923 RepID=A0ABY0FAH6_9NEIS|nr:site-specific DNA-methyltransferase [Crenobacter cavernae]RXZ42661.1 site-specific DNA-methyltransferase [Crenobacter cavernae]